MSDHDIQLVVIGIAIGVYTMLAMQIAFAIHDGRRDRKAARAAEAALAASREKAEA